MEPETEKIIAQYPELSEYQAKLIFIRKSAQEAYSKGEIEYATKGILVEIVKEATISTMTKESINEHIKHLEKARAFLVAFTQGLLSGHEEEILPELKAKHEREKRERLASRLEGSTKDKKANDLIAKAIAATTKDGELRASSTEESKIQKVTCEKCKKEVYSLKFHKC